MRETPRKTTQSRIFVANYRALLETALLEEGLHLRFTDISRGGDVRGFWWKWVPSGIAP